MNDTASNVITLLDQQQQHLEALLLLLRQELAALANRDITTAENLMAEKTSLIQKLQQADAALAAEPELAQCKHEQWFTETVTKLDNLLEQCKRQNDINQLTLEQSQLTLERFKTELLASRGKAGLTYTNKGKPTVDNKGKGIKA